MQSEQWGLYLYYICTCNATSNIIALLTFASLRKQLMKKLKLNYLKIDDLCFWEITQYHKTENRINPQWQLWYKDLKSLNVEAGIAEGQRKVTCDARGVKKRAGVKWYAWGNYVVWIDE